MTENRRKLYNLENQYICNFNNDDKKQEIISKMNVILQKITPNFTDKKLTSINDLLKTISMIHFSPTFLSEIVFINQDELANKITDKEILVARQYVEKLLDVNLELVNVDYIEDNLMTNTEGQCIACNENKHQIFYQDDKYGVMSTDLIVHEFGHAADFTISRSINDDKFLNKHISISESIAYYSQYKYLIDHGTKKQRQGLFGAFIFTYLSIVISKYCLTNNIELCDLNENNIISIESMQEIIQAYQGRVSEIHIIDKIKMIKDMHINIGALLNNEILPRYGMVLAIFLLDKNEEFINNLIKNNSIENSLENLIFEIIPNPQEDILNLESKFKNYFND